MVTLLPDLCRSLAAGSSRVKQRITIELDPRYCLEMASESEIRSVFEATPANRWLGSKLLTCGQDRALVALPIRPEFIQENGVVHGGFLSTLLDTAAVYAVVPDLPPDKGIVGVEFKVNFVKPGRRDGGEIEARARVVKRGRTLALVDVEAFQAETMLAKGLFTYMMTAARPCENG
jgi:uncharacterized protein (TIGR00369 family)